MVARRGDRCPPKRLAHDQRTVVEVLSRVLARVTP